MKSIERINSEIFKTNFKGIGNYRQYPLSGRGGSPIYIVAPLFFGTNTQYTPHYYCIVCDPKSPYVYFHSIIMAVLYSFHLWNFELPIRQAVHRFRETFNAFVVQNTDCGRLVRKSPSLHGPNF